MLRLFEVFIPEQTHCLSYLSLSLLHLIFCNKIFSYRDVIIHRASIRKDELCSFFEVNQKLKISCGISYPVYTIKSVDFELNES